MICNRKTWYHPWGQVNVELPKIGKSGYHQIVSEYEKKLFNGKKLLFGQGWERDAADFLYNLSVTPRQAKEIFLTVSFILDRKKDDPKTLWCFEAALLLMAVLKIARPKEYKSFAEGSISIQEAYQFFKIHVEYKPDWWTMICLTGNAISVQKESDIISVVGKATYERRGEYENGWLWREKGNALETIKRDLDEAGAWFS